MTENLKENPSNEGQIKINEPAPTPLVIDLEIDTKKRKLTSVVWHHFDKRKINGEEKAVCNYCKKKLVGSSRSGTRHLHDHLKICPHRKNRDIKQAILNPDKKKDGGVMLGTYAFDQEHSKQQLARMIILHEYPLNMVEHEGFRSFVSSIQPLFNHVSRNTIKKYILKIYEVEKEKTMNYLMSNTGKIAITTHMWTSNNQKRGYMVVTAHYIDDSWNLNSRIIRFIYVPSPHTAEALSKVLMQCLVAWSIDRKLSTFTLDNCSTNDAMVDYMLEKLSRSHLILGGKLVHMRCCAHILNLIVREGLDEIKEGIENIRESVVYWTATPKRVEKFEEAARQIKVSCTRKLVLDCRTRWNSTYLMISSALIYKDVFTRLTISEKKYKYLPSERDWLLATVMCDKLKLFFHITEMFSGSHYPTANHFFPKMCKIKLLLNECLTSEYLEIKAMAEKMIGKFEKYWNSIHGILGVATILDPRFKMKLIEFYFPKIYGCNASSEIEKVRKLCVDLVMEYKLNQDMRSTDDQTASVSDGDKVVDESMDDMDDYDLFVTTTTNMVTFKSEIEYYLEEAVLPRSSEFDILAWWKTNGLKYPTLQSIARDILAVPVTTVASESAFSTSGRHVTPHRNRLHPDTLEALVCAQDWLWTESRDSSTKFRKCSTVNEDIKDDDGEGSSYVNFEY